MEHGSVTTLERMVVIGGVATGVVLGLAGNVFESGTRERDIAHALSSIGLVVAAAVLAVRLARSGYVPAAAGFAIFGIAEMMIWSTGGPSASGAEGTFAMAVLFSAPGLGLVATAPGLPTWSRAAGALAAVLFAVHGFRYLGGATVTSEDGIVGVAYMLLALASLGWAWAVLRPMLRRDAHPRAAMSARP
jgi:hypothetical protein